MEHYYRVVAARLRIAPHARRHDGGQNVKRVRPFVVDLGFVGFVAMPVLGLAVTSALNDTSRLALVGLMVVHLLTLVVPLRAARHKAVPPLVFASCRRVFGLLSLFLVYVGLFALSMTLLTALFPPFKEIAGERMPVMPMGQALGAIVVAGVVGTCVCWVYFRRYENVWKRAWVQPIRVP